MFYEMRLTKLQIQPTAQTTAKTTAQTTAI